MGSKPIGIWKEKSTLSPLEVLVHICHVMAQPYERRGNRRVEKVIVRELGGIATEASMSSPSLAGMDFHIGSMGIQR